MGTAITPGTTNSAIIGTMFVTTGGDVSYTGQISLTYGGGSTPNVFFTTVVPEPGTFALLATGLVGLLAYAWRKRK